MKSQLSINKRGGRCGFKNDVTDVQRKVKRDYFLLIIMTMTGGVNLVGGNFFPCPIV